MNKLIIFDMDGTTLDTLGYTIDVMNASLLNKGYKALEDIVYKRLLGAGVAVMAKKLLEIVNPDYEKNEEAELIQEIMLNAVKWDEFRDIEVFPYIEKFLPWCQENNIKLAVLSNTPHKLTQILCSKCLPDCFEVVMGEGEVKKKPSSEGIEKICQMCNTRKEQTLLIGDTIVDMQTAANSGVGFVGVTWGCLSIEAWEQQNVKAVATDGETLKNRVADYFDI